MKGIISTFVDWKRSPQRDEPGLIGPLVVVGCGEQEEQIVKRLAESRAARDLDHRIGTV